MERGWERGVEAVLGDALEAVHVESLDDAARNLADLAAGHVMLVEGALQSAGSGASLAARVRAPHAVLRRLERVRTADSLAAALARRVELADGESLVTPDCIWVGRDWLRVARGRDAHAGVLERENRIRTLRDASERCESAVGAVEQTLRGVRESTVAGEAARDALQARIQGAHR